MKNHWVKEKEEFKKIQFVMENFNFEKTQRAMEALDWTWWDCQSVPTIDRMKKMAYDLLTDLAASDSSEISSGGFRAEKIKEDDDYWLRLTFCVEESDSVYYDEK